MVVAGLALVTAISTSFLYQSTKSELKLLKTQHIELKQDLEKCSNEAVKTEESRKIDDLSSESKQVVIKEVCDKTISTITKIKELPSKVPANTNEKNIVDIDGDLPDDFFSVLPTKTNNH
jgi:hypothetical protein